jgi:ubiquinone/menaquinone biosynthesis C-methylase UbiE
MTLQKDPERNESRYLHRFAELTDKRVLEIGCGEGRLTWQYAKSTKSTVAIDLDADGLRVALYDRPADLAQRIQFARAQSENLPFSKETFDLAVFAWSF